MLVPMRAMGLGINCIHFASVVILILDWKKTVNKSASSIGLMRNMVKWRFSPLDEVWWLQIWKRKGLGQWFVEAWVSCHKARARFAFVWRFLLIEVDHIYWFSFQPFKTTQLHFTEWPDHGVPNMDSFYDLIELHLEILRDKPVEREVGPTIVHCR